MKNAGAAACGRPAPQPRSRARSAATTRGAGSSPTLRSAVSALASSTADSSVVGARERHEPVDLAPRAR